MKLPLHWKWFFGLASLLAVLLLVVHVAINLSLPPYLLGKIQSDLERDAILARELVAPLLAVNPVDVEKVNRLAHDLSKQTGLRITVITVDGTVVGESDKPADRLALIENHLERPEIRAAQRSGLGAAKRPSPKVDADLLYVAASVNQEGLVGFVRVALPLYQIQHTTRLVRRTVATASLFVGLASVPFLFWMSRRITIPVQQMSHVAGRVAAGDFSQRAPSRVGGELGELAGALNAMSNQLETRLRELAAEKGELTAVLASMTEGVLVVDAAGKIRLLNDALQRQFQVGGEAVGKTVLEAFRNVALQEFLAEAGGKSSIFAREMSFLSPEERMFEVAAACLRARDGSRTGTVVVFHDITRIKQLENLRQDFVANVSHELRTPLSIIKGYVETLLDHQPLEPDVARQFLHTIQKNSRRLEALIDDLLTISALESQQAKLALTAVSLQGTAQAVTDELAKQAESKSIGVVVEIPPQFPAVRADAQRLHQVFSNLLDNAIKYTQSAGRVTVSAKQANGEVEICVADNGPGIAAEHLPRIFERFYRGDKARSRELGGTGLGLSIVKHIVHAHGGRVWAESDLDKGSRFYFTLPM